ncbi:HlyD family efflux transporter periplasmic adaptor subunit [Draconibacterium sp. IB214405]|uniref:efflux RND transporter periplasmic adaptor subunit n=1 Tax=Draconibacterium sp. IB214405 TaxID=3097352 RepID=UPI002A1759F6|nr:HlyD family efflux transporter periplasmic adaptor subunit [Draconibacterium sp. IB214405]MDX8341346.1 HlyD family efflux transporter periplasmic adaptor subunit [Draconibacterium sp. IB214405]
MENRSRLFVIALIVVIAGLFAACKSNSDTSVKTVVASRGPVVASFKCQGSVQAAKVVALINPERNSVVAVFKNPGDRVKEGELILQLDKSKLQSEITDLNNQILQKRNALEKNKLNAKSAEMDLGYGEENKKARILQLKASLEQQEKLLEAGGTSEARVDQLKQNIAIAEADLENQGEKNSIRLQQLEMDESNLALQIRAFEKELTEKKNLLKNMDVKAPVSGILLEVAGSVGEFVSLDQALIKVANENSFKIIGTAGKSKLHAIQPGGSVEVTSGSSKIQGTIGQVTSEDDAESVQFDVFVAEADQQKLAGAQELELLVKANDKENVLRIPKLPGRPLTQHLDILLQKGDETVRTEIVLGTIGKDFCEVISGVEEGDVILLEDPSSTSAL